MCGLFLWQGQERARFSGVYKLCSRALHVVREEGVLRPSASKRHRRAIVARAHPTSSNPLRTTVQAGSTSRGTFAVS